MRCFFSRCVASLLVVGFKQTCVCDVDTLNCESWNDEKQKLAKFQNHTQTPVPIKSVIEPRDWMHPIKMRIYGKCQWEKRTPRKNHWDARKRVMKTHRNDIDTFDRFGFFSLPFLFSPCLDFRLTRAIAYRFKCNHYILSVGIFIWRCHYKLNHTYIKKNQMYFFPFSMAIWHGFIVKCGIYPVTFHYLIQFECTFKISCISNAIDNINKISVWMTIRNIKTTTITFTRFFALFYSDITPF